MVGIDQGMYGAVAWLMSEDEVSSCVGRLSMNTLVQRLRKGVGGQPGTHVLLFRCLYF